ncbi:PQQ-binding-like beta-propeller repeat protein, partial [bacterium]|nr:PQQ-binding-like beta-propeller repeat protein [bacterium]
MRKVTIVATLAMALCSGATARAAGEIESVLTPVRARGLVVHLGCEGEMFADWLRGNDSTVAHVLCVDPANVAKARDLIRKEGLYGPVSVSRLVGESLPYADNLVNLLVATDLCGVAQEEILRVLVPGGEAFLPAAEGMRKVVKPWPDDIDEWTHDLHDAGGNPVASDRVVGPPRQLQWTAGPLWARSHGWTPSVSAMVSARGRLFAIVDETLTCVDGTVPSKWVLTARDAFNGVLLWKVPVPQWGSAEHTGTPDNGAGITTGRFTMPPQVGKRLVAVGDTVYVTLGARAPVTALDAATGKVRGVYKGTERTDEILCSDRRLYLAINPEQKGAVVDKGETPAPVPGKQVCVVDAKTGRMLWKKGPFTAVRTAKLQDAYGRLELAAEGGRVFLLTAEAIECLDGKSGERVWSVDRPVIPADAVRRIGFAGMFEYLLTVMVVHDGVVLVAQPEPNTHHTYHTMPGALTAFDAKDGRVMWKHGYGGWGHCTQPDVFVVGDTVWTHVDAKTEYGSVWGSGKKAKDGSKVNYRIQALDLKTGALRKEQPTKDIFNVGHHHRCYRNRSTERFLLASRRGAEFVDLASGENTQNHWVRSGCLLGNLPCNGLLYVAPHPCGCYRTALITGFNALAPAPSSAKATEGRSASPRLVKGLAFGGIPDAKSQMPDSQDWPTYRHDPQRSGATESPVPTKLAVAWTAKVGGKPSAPVIANGKVLVADVDAHTVHALGADDGKTLWSHTADGRVDSPPTIHQGRAIFGSADGRVTCLRASDGALAWRFTAAPRAHRVMAHGQLESPWPVHGSVLVHDGKVWCGAGR